MTTLYKPVLIETAEQAEALPEGVRVLEDRGGLPRAWAKSGDVFLGHGLVLLVAREVVGMQALVPIEAEEQWGLMDADGTTYRAGSREHAQRWQQTIGTPLVRRLVTLWEEV